MKMIYQGDLPHIQPPGATFFITFRLFGSIPKTLMKEISEEFELLTKINKSNRLNKKTASKERLKLILKYDDYLHHSDAGPHYLKSPKIAKLVCDAMHFHDEKLYDLLAYCVMSNHVHIVFTPTKINDEDYVLLEKIMHSIKSYTASKANKILNRESQFWMHESFDHYIRSEAEFESIIQYVLHNPVKAGLVKKADDWPWSYCKVPPSSLMEGVECQEKCFREQGYSRHSASI